MTDSSKGLNIYIISENPQKNFEGKTDRDVLLSKLVRDGLNPAVNRFFYLVSSPIKKTEKISDNIILKNILRQGFFRRIFGSFFGDSRIIKGVDSFESDPDLIIVYNPELIRSAVKIRKARGGKVVTVLTNLPLSLVKTRNFGVLKALYYKLIGWSCSGEADIALVISDATRKYAVSLGIPEDKIYMFSPNVIKPDLHLFLKADAGAIRKKHGISANKKIILSVGRLEKEKNYPRLIQVFDELNKEETILVIVGDGSERLSLLNEVKRRGIEQRVIFTGSVGRTEIWNYFCAADVFVILSKSEGLGLVVWEAMYAGVPVIGSDAEGIKESLGENGERGIIVASNESSKEVGEKIQKVLERGPMIDRIIERARNYVEEKITRQGNINEIWTRMA